ncbi:MAG: glycosyl transferase group 2 family protein [Hyphomonadaceae bacterium]|nr:MAG: glycosyl transferase group 2 family protein [Hyphomonadaceae bacterium]KAF0186832.1 MAG: glycosyl transferase group 2 family protein [Hyphomonadaceae bacterium]
MTKTSSKAVLDISVVVPVHNESGAIEQLVREISAALQGYAFEIIVVDDLSKDNTLQVLQAAKTKFPELRVFAHQYNAGQSAAIISGVRAARAPIIGTLDGDGQNDPKDLPKLLRALTRVDAPNGLAMVAGMRLKRQDSAAKKYASKIANAVRQFLLNDDAIDSGCGIKVVKRDLFLNLPYFDHMHRYMAALIKQSGYSVEFLEVHHRARETGASKYTNFGRLLAALSDLFGVIWLSTRHRNSGKLSEIK